MKNKVLKILTGGLVCCCMLQSMVLAADTTDNDTYVIDAVVNNGGVLPASTYFNSAAVSIQKNASEAVVQARTVANTTVDHIYQDITIYKNYQWVSSERYDTYNGKSLLTTITLAAKTGDYIDVYVDNYIVHNGVTEKVSTSKAETL